MPGWPGCPPEIQATSEFYFWTNRQLHESKNIDSGNTSDKRILLWDQPTVTRIQEYRFRKYKQRVSFPFGLNDSCTNQTILTLEMHATDDIYFWTERQLHDRKGFDAGSASVRRLLLLDRTTVTQSERLQCRKCEREASSLFKTLTKNRVSHLTPHRDGGGAPLTGGVELGGGGPCTGRLRR